MSNLKIIAWLLQVIKEMVPTQSALFVVGICSLYYATLVQNIHCLFSLALSK